VLTDEAIIKIKAGDGGDGIASFRREKYVPKGGPDGGDGGAGGNIYFVCDANTHTLSDFARRKYFEATRGENGRDKRQHGKSAEDLYLRVPPGTVVKVDSEIFHDFTQASEKVLAARGGRGGLGNVHFATATHQTPRERTLGTKGEEKTFKLELKLLADVGLVGLPNSGKSTLLSRISNAKPKIADYPFTTLEPNLGVASYHEKSFVVADVPGLIEGASKGKGLGDKFLRHLERTKVLVHILDINSPDIAKDYRDIKNELKAWNEDLLSENEIIVLNKIDTLLPKEADKIAKKFTKDIKQNILTISAVSGEGTNELLKTVAQELK